MTSHEMVQLVDDMSDSSQTNFVRLERPSRKRAGGRVGCPSAVSDVSSAGDVDLAFDFSAGRDQLFGDEKPVRHIVIVGWVTIFFSLPQVGKWRQRRFNISKRTSGADNADAATDGRRLTRL